jgi:SAM-dependent methyltransferase
MSRARYDGVANWYDDFVSGFAQPFTDRIIAALGRTGKEGVVLDLGCGTGVNSNAIAGRGWAVVGLDISSDQLRVASTRRGAFVRADAAQLPMRAASISAVIAAFVHTDIDNFAAGVAEVARVLVPGGTFIYVGTHPCFLGPFIKRTNEQEAAELTLHRGYGDPGLVYDGSGTSPGLKAKVGSRNLSLAAFLGSFLDAGLHLRQFEELDTAGCPWTSPPSDGSIVPWNVFLIATR